MIKAADMLIARRADTRARADFATWKMMAQLNGSGDLPPEALESLAYYHRLREKMSEAEASEAAIAKVYRIYYSAMGGGGTPPNVPARSDGDISVIGVMDNVTEFRRPPPRPKTGLRQRSFADTARQPLPAFLIFICLAAIYVVYRTYWR